MARAQNTPHSVIAASLRRLQRLRASRQVHKALSLASGVDLPQQATEVLLALDDRMSLADLARAAQMDTGATSRQVSLLEDLRLVRKEQHPDNASAILVSRTTRGSSLAVRMVEIRDRHLTSVLDKWSRDDKERLAELLERLLHDLEKTPYQSTSRRT
jgi:DNA-binding MarR family transcriptional regulator